MYFKTRASCPIKKGDAGYSDVVQVPNAEQICKTEKENQVLLKER